MSDYESLRKRIWPEFFKATPDQLMDVDHIEQEILKAPGAGVGSQALMVLHEGMELRAMAIQEKHAMAMEKNAASMRFAAWAVVGASIVALFISIVPLFVRAPHDLRESPQVQSEEIDLFRYTRISDSAN